MHGVEWGTAALVAVLLLAVAVLIWSINRKPRGPENY